MLVSRFVRFVLVGGLATGIQYGLLILLAGFFGVGPVLASAIGFVISAVANYYINYHYTFRSSQKHGAALTKFSILAGIGLAINSAIMSGLVRIGFHYLAAQLVATLVVLLWNFAGNHWWTFRITADAESPRPYPARNRIAEVAGKIPVIAWVLSFAACVRVPALLGGDALSGGMFSSAAGGWCSPWVDAPSAGISLDRMIHASMHWIGAHAVTKVEAAGLVAGLLPLIPFFRLVQRGFGRRAAVIAGLYLAIYGSYLAVSEASISAAVLIFLTLWGLEVFSRERQSPRPALTGLLVAGILVTAAGLFSTRGWLLSAAIASYLLVFRDTRRYAVPFGILASAPLLMLQLETVGRAADLLLVNGAAGGQALNPPQSPAGRLLLDPALFLHSPGPVICALAVAGLYRAMKRKIRGDLAVIAVLMAAAAALPSLWRPDGEGLAEYWVLSGILMLSYAAAATAELRGGIGASAAAAVLVISIAVQAAT